MTALTRAGTFSKDPALWGISGYHIISANGCKVELNDGNGLYYIDWTSSLGQNLLGQGGEFAEVVIEQVKKGLCGTLPFWLEYEVADRLADMMGNNVPGWSPDEIGVRFGKTGSDVTQAAIRLARAVTGCENIVTFTNHYHGWGQEFIARTEPGLGILGNIGGTKRLSMRVTEAEWGNELSLNRLCGVRPAAVIFEHPPTEPKPGWALFLRSWCDRNGALLIADEVVTGMRNGLGGACGLWGYEPDLICLGKALGNGAAVSALAGRKELMDWFALTSPVFWSSTTNGNPADLAAALYVLNHWTQEDVALLWGIGGKILEALTKAGLDVFGHAPRNVIRFKDETQRGYFIKAMAKRGHLVNRPQFANLAMSPDNVEALATAAQEVTAEMSQLSPEELAAAAEPLPMVLFTNR